MVVPGGLSKLQRGGMIVPRVCKVVPRHAEELSVVAGEIKIALLTLYMIFSHNSRATR